MRQSLVVELRKHVEEAKELEDGYAYRFSSQEEVLDKIMQLIRIERECCKFIHFVVDMEVDDGPIWLKLKGPKEVKPFFLHFFGPVDKKVSQTTGKSLE